MIVHEPLAPLRAGAPFHVASAVALDSDFDVRWAAWVTRGLVLEQRARRRFVTGFSLFAIGAAVIYAFLRS
jgi:hypothetical protein